MPTINLARTGLGLNPVLGGDRLKTSESTFLPNEPRLSKKKNAAFWEVPPDFSYEQCVDDDYGALGKDTDRESRSTRRKTSPNATLPTINLTWIDLRSKAALLCERPATNRLNHCTAFQDKENPQMYLNIQSVPRSKHTPSLL